MGNNRKHKVDEDETYRPLEPHEHQELYEKRIEKLDSRISRMEAILEKMMLCMKKAIESQKSLKQELAENNDPAEKACEERIRFLEQQEQRISEDIARLAKEENDIDRKLGYRRKQDAWFALVMLDCKYKVSEHNHLNCTRTGKRCNYRNCPLKGEVDAILA